MKYISFRYHPYDAVTISQANRKANFGNTEDSSSVFNMWKDVVIVEEDQRSRYKSVILICTICVIAEYKMRQSAEEKGD